jgi:hypothetical protein
VVERGKWETAWKYILNIFFIYNAVFLLAGKNVIRVGPHVACQPMARRQNATFLTTWDLQCCFSILLFLFFLWVGSVRILFLVVIQIQNGFLLSGSTGLFFSVWVFNFLN